MMLNSHATEIARVMATVDPQTVANTERFTDTIDMSKCDEALFIVQLGNMTDGENFVVTIEEHAVASADGATGDIKSKTLTAAAGNDNTQLVTSVRAEDLTTGMRYVRAGVVTNNTAGGPVAVVGLGFSQRYTPETDLASVTIW